MSVTAVFGAVAGHYASARPDYPAEVYAALADLSGRGLDRALVADVGAGTGIAARQMRDRGAVVIAIEPSVGMLAELVAGSPGVRVLRGDGNALPLCDSCADFVTYAQAWHWTDPHRAAPEYRRVLRPGGSFAAWWNLTARQAPWEVAQEQRLVASCPSYREGRDRYPGAGQKIGLAALSLGRPAKVAEFGWSRRVTLDVHLANLNSKSYVADLGRRGVARFLDAERAALLAEFPHGVVTEAYRTVLAVVRP
jgi:SAM-dependent methyltransferase